MTHLEEVAHKALKAKKEKDAVGFHLYAKELSKMVGKWDSAGRYFIHNEYKTDTSEKVRNPSRAWPYSEYAHVQTVKYIKALLSNSAQFIAKVESEQLKEEFKTIITTRKVKAL